MLGCLPPGLSKIVDRPPVTALIVHAVHAPNSLRNRCNAVTSQIMCKHCVLYYGPIWCSGVPSMYRREVLNATSLAKCGVSLHSRLDNLLVSQPRLLLVQMYETPCRKGMPQMQWRCYVGRQVVQLLHGLLPRPDRLPSIKYATDIQLCERISILAARMLRLLSPRPLPSTNHWSRTSLNQGVICFRRQAIPSCFPSYFVAFVTMLPSPSGHHHQAASRHAAR